MHQFTCPPTLTQILELIPSFQFLLWDMDGTIMETEALHTQATVDILRKYSPQMPYSPDQIDQLCLGATDAKCWQDLKNLGLVQDLNLEEFIHEKTQSIKDQLQNLNPKNLIKTEVLELMKALYEKGHKQAIVTSSEKDVTKLLVEKLGLNTYMDFILTREDTPENKPSPLPYNTAMKKFGAKKEECLILEDSPTGLAAARSSGAHYFQAMWY